MHVNKIDPLHKVPGITRRLLIAAIIMLSISGCTTYQPKPGDPIAKLRFVSFTEDPSDIYIQDPNPCPERKRLVYKQISGLFHSKKEKDEMLGEAESGSVDTIALVIPADRTALMTLGSGLAPTQYTSGYQCSVGVKFEPQPMAQYEVQYHYTNHRCSVKLFRLVIAPNGEVKREHESTASSFHPRGYDLCLYQ